MDYTYDALEEYLDGLRKDYTDAVDFIVKKATEKSEDGTYSMNLNDVPGIDDMASAKWTLAPMLEERPEVISADAHGHGFELTLDPQYCERMIVDPDSIPESHLRSPYATDLIATFEELLPVKEQDRVTYYWGDYGGFVMKNGVTNDQLRPAYAEALQAVNMSSDAYQDKKFTYRSEVETLMRGCMLARILEPDDEVIYIPPAPTGPNGQWVYETGTVSEVNIANKNCVVSFFDGVATIPFRYVVGRFRDQDFDGNAFGFEHAEPVFGMTESQADRFLWETKQEYDRDHPDDIIPVRDAPDFTARMLNLPGVNKEMLPDWIQHSFEMAVGEEEDDGVPRAQARENALNEFAETFENIESHYPGTAAKIFNYRAGYVAHELYGAAAFIAENGSPSDAYEMANAGVFEDAAAPDEDEDQGLTLQ